MTLQKIIFVLYYSQCEEEKIDFCEIKIQLFTSKNGLNLLGIDWRDYVQISIRRG